jgi:glutamate/tyrosine decarboxylase-like PLP-dependent enzyme
MYWKSLPSEEIKRRVFLALGENSDYRKGSVLGFPATYLDEIEFYEDAPFLKQAAFLSAFLANPNHIGCHTLGENQSEHAFRGTQLLEKEVIGLCAEEIFSGEKNQQDGYISSGGTEANIEALWIYRNYFRKIFGAGEKEVAVMFSCDSHYSIAKGANLLDLYQIPLQVDKKSRNLDAHVVKAALDDARSKGCCYFIVVLNMGTTMFGSVDDIDVVTKVLVQESVNFKLHIDAAFGGFIYPFINESGKFSFLNEHITSIALDAHKLLQAPYGTGIFLVRKGWMDFVRTEEASYVPGSDYTLCGSRSGANAVAVWMILMRYGCEGWRAKMAQLLTATESVCERLKCAGIEYYRNPFINIIAIPASELPETVARKYFLVPDVHDGAPSWWKIVIMPHVKKEMIDHFIEDLHAFKHITLS